MTDPISGGIMSIDMVALGSGLLGVAFLAGRAMANSARACRMLDRLVSNDIPHLYERMGTIEGRLGVVEVCPMRGREDQ